MISLEESNREILPFRSYEVSLKNPVAFSKKSEKEKIIRPEIDFNNGKSKKEENLQDDDEPIYNYPYEFYEEIDFKSEEIKNENIIKEEKKS